MKKSVALLVTIFLCFWGSFGFCASNPPQPEQVKLNAEYGGLPLAFIKNQGQVDEQVLYYLKGREGTIYFTKSGIVYDLIKKDVGAPVPAPNDPVSSTQDQTFSRLSFTLKPQGANADVQVIPQDELPGKINYFIGNDSTKWHTNIPIYKSIIYQGLYPGIDLKVYGTNRQMEYDFIVHPGADPKAISLAGEGIEGLEVDAEGNLIIKTALTDIKHLKPVIYQEVDGKRLTVDGSFTTSQNRIGFDIKNYNKTYPLTIDPLTLSYSTYLGGNNTEDGKGIAVDSQGCAYVTGYTISSDFPTANAYDSSYNNSTDVFISKFTALGDALSYSTYLGGIANDQAYGIAVDSQGCAYLTGFTSSSAFPTANAFQGTKGGGYDVFVTKLTATGDALSYSTYLGGSSDDEGNGVAVDNSGCVYVTGYTKSTNFSTANAYDSSYNTNTDAFVTKFTAAGNALSYSTYLGGNGGDIGYGIAIDSSGCVYVTGTTGSLNFPTVNALQGTRSGTGDAFATKFTAAGNGLFYSTYFGGSGSTELGHGIAVDSSGCSYITGYTNSNDFPTANPYQGTKGSSVDAFVSKLTFCLVPVADFSATPTSGYAPLTVAFTDQTTNSPTSWSWNFGDEGTSDLQNPSHQYTTPGTYTVSLTATNACNNDTETKTDYITVNACPVPVANFSATPNEGCAPLTVTFTDQSTNSPTTWSWDFGDEGTSDLQNPTHEYTSPNTYTVTLIAGNFCGSDSETTQIIVVPLSIDITSPQNGESFLASPITVNGTVSCSATEVTVNGQPSTVNGQQFTAENVPLVTGSNTITAVATYEGSNAQDSVSVFLLVPQGPVQYFYDDLGRLIKAQDDASHVIEYSYDSVGNRQTKTITVP
jgi:YD repeat-containing protein